MGNRVVMTLDEQKKVMLDMLISFADFCQKHELRYFLDAGTLLGAVRHKGYIPWDDDIDVCMPRTDHDKFVALVKETGGYIEAHYRVEFPEETIYPFLKISDDRTILVEFPDKYPMEVGVYLDVFAKDGIKDDSADSKRLCKVSEWLGLMHWFNKFSIYAWKEKGSVLKKLIAHMGRWIIREPNVPIRWQDRLIHKNQKKNPLEKCRYVTTLTNGEFHKIAPKECFAEYVMLEFEGIPFRCPIGYDTYLKCLYPGDYMQLPPEEKRVKQHSTYAYFVSEEAKADIMKK